MIEIKHDEIKRKWNRIDESVRRFNKTGEEFYSYTVTPDMTRDVFELIAEVERLQIMHSKLIEELKKADVYSEKLEREYLSATLTEVMGELSKKLRRR
ncbi:hypothetical protein [Cytobacillus purgationiresistens]|uniref:CelD/BcsL family acetyltransferase involved in cellulose biosynthesis n=1 Tax=Cytobacillus purgationiresistens TaxID=863449 RepID=A0ABU0AHT7_9BACI|nr:hypothetical protein [Cytobacillus purgationiresistens]MDQ0270797.1 CelD/BcsL family acetyltransferase involved in cellulose biosynthesis [Cytobacillus purgationiresistens]